MTIIYEDANVQVIETITANGKTVQTINKPGSLAANREAIEQKARQAITANQAFLALASPTAAQNTAQVKRLTRAVNGLLRILLDDLADVSDT